MLDKANIYDKPRETLPEFLSRAIYRSSEETPRGLCWQRTGAYRLFFVDLSGTPDRNSTGNFYDHVAEILREYDSNSTGSILEICRNTDIGKILSHPTENFAAKFFMRKNSILIEVYACPTVILTVFHA